MAAVRAGLVLTIFEKVVRLKEESELESKATVRMISDVQRIVGGIEYMYEVAAGVLEAALATYLLYRIVGFPASQFSASPSVSSFKVKSQD